MESNRAPQIPLSNLKRTKIIATVGPSTNSYDDIVHMIQAGANGLRLNFSHGTNEERDKQIKWIRKAADNLKQPVAIIQDLQGPKIRLGDFDDIINVDKGQSITFQYRSDYSKTGNIPLQYDLSKKVKRGERLYLFDGKIQTVVTSISGDIIHVRAENEGVLVKRKGINVPDTDLEGDILTEKDKEDLAYGSTADIDYVALSFVQKASDITKLRKHLKSLGSDARVIAKIETKSALDNLQDIVRESDAVMVARGDLATETLAEAVPIVQRRIIGLGLKYSKPTIVATQMLGSMVDSPEPSRAEVSDVATAVLVGADCVMLSDETASGHYPIESVKVMKRIVRYTELNPPLKATFFSNEKENTTTKQAAVCSAALQLAESVNAKAIVAETKSGATALQISSHRGNIPVIAVTSTRRVANQMAIVFGIKAYERPEDRLQATKLTNWLHRNKVLSRGDVVVSASGQHPGMVGATDTIKVRIL